MPSRQKPSCPGNPLRYRRI